MARQRQTVPATRKEVYCQVLLACLFYALMALLPLGVLAAPADSGTAASGSNPAEDAAAISVAPARQQVSVGYDESGSYTYKTAAGEFRGLTVEFLYELA